MESQGLIHMVEVHCQRKEELPLAIREDQRIRDLEIQRTRESERRIMI
jgi:hypothetical protein